MSLHLPDLLNSLAEIFARPGIPARDLGRADALAPWIPGGLRAALWGLRASLENLAAMEQEDMSVAYADHFLVSQEHPLLYLEASVHRTGLLRDPGILAELELIYAALGFDVPEGRSPDHLATELEALAVGLQRLGALGNGDSGPLLFALNTLLDQHLSPLLENLNAVAATRPMHPAYAEALATARVAAELARSGLHSFA